MIKRIEQVFYEIPVEEFMTKLGLRGKFLYIRRNEDNYSFVHPPQTIIIVVDVETQV